jgi:2-polyprenyl-3-methyl-5-hydroxy-6-metoxy-1,4-benzoquinol methylase
MKHAQSESSVSSAPLTSTPATDPSAAARWEFNDRRNLLYALVGYDFGMDPENRLDEIRRYKANEAKYLIDSLNLQPQDRVLDLGSGCGFIARVVAPLCKQLHCVDISAEFLDFCREELREFPNTEFHRIDFGNLQCLEGKRINKGYANAVFIHFNLFDVVLYFKQLFQILEPGGRFVLGMSDTDCLDILDDKYFGVVLEAYSRNRREPTLMHWNSSKAVCAAAEKIGFRSKVLCSGGGSAMVLLEKPQPLQSQPQNHAPDKELTATFRQWNNTISSLRNSVQAMVTRYPDDLDVRYLFAATLQASGMDDVALAEYEVLLDRCPSNERHRVRQAIEQCRADNSYFPPAFSTRLNTAEYAAGHNAEVWRKYARREVQRAREIVRTLRQVTTLRGKRVLDVGSGYGGMLIAMAEQGALPYGIEVDHERAETGRKRLAELGLQVAYEHDDICTPDIEARLGTFDVIVCQDVLEHVLEPSRVIQSVSRMLRPGGVVFVQIPNKYGIDQLMSDHHYSLTGITALSRNQAIEYWRLATSEPPENYSVGYERGEKFYRSAFSRHGVNLFPAERYGSMEHVLWFAPKVSEMCTRLEREVYPGLRPDLAKRIRRRMTAVAALYAHASKQIASMADNPELSAAACDAVVRRLCLGLWRFIGVKTHEHGKAV